MDVSYLMDDPVNGATSMLRSHASIKQARSLLRTSLRRDVPADSITEGSWVDVRMPRLDVRVRRFLEAAAILVVGIVAVIAVAVWAPPYFVPRGLAPKEAATNENDVRGTLLQGLLGAAFLLAAYFTWRQVQIAERGQITARFKDAVDQLGSESADIRLGGIYSVGQIAKDNPKTYGTLMVEILGAFVRRRSQLPESTENEGVLPVDIEASLRVLFRRESPSKNPLNLTRANLTGADLTAYQNNRALAPASVVESRVQKLEVCLSLEKFHGTIVQQAQLRVQTRDSRDRSQESSVHHHPGTPPTQIAHELAHPQGFTPSYALQ
jgi:hypothetical protein